MKRISERIHGICMGKPDGTLAENQNVLFLGYHNPEKWLAVSGKKTGTNTCKIWENGNGYKWSTFWSPEIDTEGWHNITLSGKSGQVTAGAEVAVVLAR